MDVFSARTVALVTTSLGGFDKLTQHEPQSLDYDLYRYEEPLRDKSMTPRLQAKIPKMFAWQLYPDYQFYMWLDGNLRLKNKDSLRYFLDNCRDYDVVVLQHPSRNTIHWEYRYNWRGLHNNKPSSYLQRRYINELLDEQYEVIKSDNDYVDNLLVNGGVFMYRNTEKVQQTLKEWWYHVSRYLIMDQLAWAYVLKKSGLRVSVLTDIFNDCPWIEDSRHAK